ncbi:MULTISPECIES: response regulator [Flavobacterium]|uniref:response regulator n=1 Tax=Flavobacterium TaxID=237 RepID=UPI001FCC9380|nr:MULTISPECIES: response regulator [Flavobacterium]UOK42005.1 response regulator [Flavobacterium enshiense]
MLQKRIYIIDDDPIYQLVTKKLIEKTALFEDSRSFVNGSEALSYFENTGDIPDIILLDIEMPEMDGWDFLDQLLHIEKSFEKDATIYIASSSIALEDKMKARSYPCVKDFLSKPMDIEKLKTIAAE